MDQGLKVESGMTYLRNLKKPGMAAVHQARQRIVRDKSGAIFRGHIFLSLVNHLGIFFPPSNHGKP